MGRRSGSLVALLAVLDDDDAVGVEAELVGKMLDDLPHLVARDRLVRGNRDVSQEVFCGLPTRAAAMRLGIVQGVVQGGLVALDHDDALVFLAVENVHRYRASPA